MNATAEAASSTSLTITEEASSDKPTSELAAAAISTSTSKDAGEKGLKKAWLNLLPVERVVEIVLKYDAQASPELKREIWPEDLKTAVFNAAVATLIESSAKGKSIDLSSLGLTTPLPTPDAGGEKADVSEPATVRDASPSTDVEDIPLVVKLNEAASSSQAQIPPMFAASASTSASTSIAPPATAMTPYGSSVPYHYTYSYPLHQAYPYVYSVPPTSAPESYSPGPSTPSGSKSRAPDRPDDDDLPSYEEMLVQALLEHNDPGGTAPKQLFQWMAAHYPLQANFRPSASQALQKAYKRGRFEKNKDGKYRLNATWEGGNTSKRTTRRPQSYAKAVTNPSPSSHPPANPSYPSYMWQAAQKQPARNSPSAQQEAAKTIAAATALPEGGIADVESHRDAWEAAQSILQALNFGAPLQPAPDGSKQPVSAISVPIDPQLVADSGTSPALLLPSTTAASSSDAAQAPSMTALSLPSAVLDGAQADANPSRALTDRTELQRSLALLVSQLTDLAKEDDSTESAVANLPSNEWPTLAEAVSVMDSAES